jgi:hypothetical protein
MMLVPWGVWIKEVHRRSWPDDAPHLRICEVCDNDFEGHAGRALCKVCHQEDQENQENANTD